MTGVTAEQPDNARGRAARETDSDFPSPSDQVLWAAADDVAMALLLSPHLATASRRSYRADLRDLFRYARGRGTSPLELDRGSLLTYLDEMRMYGLAPATVARRRSVTGTYFALAVDLERIPRNPLTGVRGPVVPRRPPRVVLDAVHLRSMLEASRRESHTYTAMAVLTFTGIRAGELLALDADDVILHQPTRLRVLRKGGRHVQVVDVSTVAAEALERHLNGRRSGPLLMSRTGRRWSYSGLSRALRTVARRSLPEQFAARFHVHALRASFIRLALEADMSLWRVVAAAGHHDPRHTLRYARSVEREGSPVTHLVQHRVLAVDLRYVSQPGVGVDLAW